MKKSLTILIFIFVYLNIGHFLNNEYMRSAYMMETKGQTIWLNPMKHNGVFHSFMMEDNSHSYSFEEWLEVVREDDGFSEMFQTALVLVLWPLLLIILSGWQWVLLALKFIFLGGLVSLVIKNLAVTFTICVVGAFLAGGIVNTYLNKKQTEPD